MSEPANTEAKAPDMPAWTLRTNPWVTFLLPFVVFLLSTSLEPTPQTPGGEVIGLSISYDYYPVVYTLKLALTIAAMRPSRLTA